MSFADLARLREYMLEACRLPGLTLSTWQPWAIFGRKVILFLTDGHPEEITFLRQIGLFRQDSYYKKLASVEDVAELKKTLNAERTEESNIRAGIFEAIGKTYASIIEDESEDGTSSSTSIPG